MLGQRRCKRQPDIAEPDNANRGGSCHGAVCLLWDWDPLKARSYAVNEGAPSMSPAIGGHPYTPDRGPPDLGLRHHRHASSRAANHHLNILK
jgi:hypothetical protein